MHEQIRQILKERKLSQRWLSDKSGVALITISLLLNGHKMGNLRTYYALAEALDCEIKLIEKSSGKEKQNVD